jgi:SAM-dependent methyltransferase
MALEAQDIDCRVRLDVAQERSPETRENPGFLAQDRPASYAATQDIILPKGPVYEQMLRQIPRRPERILHLAEFGFGTGAFLNRLVAELLKRQQPARIVAFDLSPAMGDFARAELKRVLNRADHLDGPDIHLQLVTGFNCLHPAFQSPYLEHGSLDAVIQMQFAHYAPNGPGSPLAQRDEKEGVAKIAKRQWFERVHRWLRPGGVLLDFDDFDFSCPLTNEISLRAWDLWVLRSLTDARVQEAIAQAHPSLGRSIAKAYPPGASLADLLVSVERRRRKRRSFCREESASLDACQQWLGEVFGPGQTLVLENPIGFSHHRFHLLASRKREL